MDLQIELQKLAAKGCYPCLSMRGFKKKRPVWRAHVNGAGNFWGEGRTPLSALKSAISCWKKAGYPMDGYGVCS
jgi:hypothetical protein